ncbi:MAG: hypothetical protein H7Y30_09945 [Pyrinomonadaceae bacterium]|nr:hypothetical protein [Pyrinomonadaceae bacterium]
MEIISNTSIASVELAEVRASIDEITTYEAALSYLLEALSAEEIEQRLNASRDEVEGMCDDLRQIISVLQTSTPEPISA